MKRLGFGLAPLLLMVACAGFPFFERQSSLSASTGTLEDAGSTNDGTQAPPHVVMEVQDVQYDGLALFGRVLISPVSGNLRLDKRLIPTVAVNVGPVSNCDSDQPVTYVKACVLPPPARPEDFLLLEPGYWYGRTVRFSLFDEDLTGLGPECIETDIFLVTGGKRVASQRLRAMRTLAQTPDGDVPREPRPTPDAGSP